MLHDRIKNQNKMKVVVTGGNNRSNQIISNSPVVTTPKNDVNKTPVTNIDTNQFANIRKMLADNTMSPEAAANMIILEIKRVYIDCIHDERFERFGAEELSYLDEKLFNSLEEIICDIIIKSLTVDAEFQASVYKEMINTAIASSIKIFDYEEEFDFDIMNYTIEKFIKDFDK